MAQNRGYTFAGVCKGTTKAGAPCRRIVIFANGYCCAHGGDSTDYMRERARKIAEKAERRFARWKRRLEALQRDGE